MTTDETDDFEEERKPRWRCQACGYKDEKKPMPADRAKFYSNPKPAKCPRCKSDEMMPEGF